MCFGSASGDTRTPPQLLDYEPRAADQVPLLMSMQENELALNKAIESGDSDLGTPMDGRMCGPPA